MPSRNKDEWSKKTLAPALNKFPERQLEFETTSGIPLSTVYSHEDVPTLDYAASLGYPGEYPFTQGIQPTMYLGSSKMAQDKMASLADADAIVITRPAYIGINVKKSRETS